MKRKFAFPLLILALALPLLAAEEGTFDRTLKVTGPVDLDVNTGSGSILVRSGGDGQVVVHATIRAGECCFWDGGNPAERIKAIQDNPPIEQSGNVIRIGHIREDRMRNVSISYEITTPRQTRLTSRSGSGHQTVAGLVGPAEAGTGSGGIRISDIASDVRLSTGSGNIEIAGIGGSVRAHAGSGSITADKIGGGSTVETSAKYEGKALPLVASGTNRGSGNAYLDFETGSGNIGLTGISGELRARTGSGRIEAEGRQAGDWELHTGSGSVRVRLPAQAAFSLNARTSSGSIDSDFPITVQGSMSRHELAGVVNGGGSRLDIHTGSGSIRIEK